MKKSALTAIIIVIAGTTLWAITNKTQSQLKYFDKTEITMYKNKACECCNRWAGYLETQGYLVTIKVTDDLAAVKENHNVQGELASCHTAIVEGYVVEGHVPAGDIDRMLKEHPDAIGIAAPGMPASSPGMDIPTNETYDVLLFDKEGNSSVYATH